MLVSSRRVTESILETLERLRLRGDIPKDVAYELNGVATVLRQHVNGVEFSDDGATRDLAARLDDLLNAMRADEALSAPSVQSHLRDAAAEISAVAAAPEKGDQLDQAFIAAMTVVDQRFGAIFEETPELAIPLFARFSGSLVDHKLTPRVVATSTLTRAPEVSPGEPTSVENLGAYMRHVLADPSATVSNITVLPGGFGKETTLFSVVSETMKTDLVMRRDAPIELFNGLDSHTASTEFPILKAAFARGIPVPEPLWQEDSSSIVKGPPFTIMRRSPGAVSGDFIGGQGRVQADLQRTLARTTAALHKLPRMTELSHLPSFASARWGKTAHDSATRYMESWYANFRNTPHMPLPALHGLYNWMLANLPESDAASTFVHGDIGFHNLLFDDGKLSAVLDWEFAHVGDPAEDLGYIRGVMGGQLNWPDFIATYAQEGLPVPSEQRIRYFEIWSNVRNATLSAQVLSYFETGQFRNIKYAMIFSHYLPYFIAQAQSLITKFHTA